MTEFGYDLLIRVGRIVSIDAETSRQRNSFAIRRGGDSTVERRDLIRHRMDHGCELVREGGNRSWWGNSANGHRSAVPRHKESSDYLARKICRDLGISEPSFRTLPALQRRKYLAAGIEPTLVRPLPRASAT